MDTFVVRITPRRIERLIYGLIIIALIFSTAHYANKYYDTTPEDKGYLDKLFSGTFFAEVPTQTKLISAEENNSSEEEVETVENATIEDENETAAETTESEEETQEIAPEEEDEECTGADFKVVSFDTEKIEDSWKEGIIESIKLSYCNLEDTENYMMAEIYFWNQFDEDEGNVNIRKTTPFNYTPKTVSLFPKEKHIEEYTFENPKSILTNPKFSYKISYYYVDKDGEKINTTAVGSISNSYTIK